MLTSAYEDSVDEERKQYEEQPESLLNDTDYPADNAEQKELIKDYSTGPYDHAVLKNAYRSNFTIAGGKTPAAKTTNDFPVDNKSPMTKVKRPPRPATGENPRG